MCGIALIVGAGAEPALFRQMMRPLAARGDIEEAILAPGLFAGTHRLRIVDRDRAVQPWLSHRRPVPALLQRRGLQPRRAARGTGGAGQRPRTASDTEVVLDAFLAWGPAAVRRLRGEFAFAIVERATGRTYLARDPLGVKPLYWSRRDGRLHVASEVKALVPVGAPITEVPPGHHGWAQPDGSADGGDPDLGSYVDLLRLGTDRPTVEDPDEAAKLVREAVRDSIRVRVDTDLTVGVVLSGGLDSSVTLLNVRELHPDCVAFTIGAPGSEDLDYARRLTRELGVPHEVDRTATPGHPAGADPRGDPDRRADRVRRHHQRGRVRTAVPAGTGGGRQGGAHRRRLGRAVRRVPDVPRGGARQARRLFLHKIRNLCRTELHRVDRASMGHGVEARVPFLDLNVVELAMRLPST